MSSSDAVKKGKKIIAQVDWFMFAAALTLSLLGMATMHSYTSENFFFLRQAVWVLIAVVAFFASSIPSYHFLRRTSVITGMYGVILVLLLLIFILGAVVLGATTRFHLGAFAVQPADPAKLVLVMVLAKYFARRHTHIADIRHIIISGLYAFALFVCVFFQPDFGSGIVIAAIWFGMTLVSGLSRKHFITLILIAVVAAGGAWHFALKPYQKARIMNFVHPMSDVHGTGYNAYQSTIAVGSGQVLGKGIGFGTQSKLQFLPEFQTDFIFAAFAEEWGLIGVIIVMCLFGIIITRALTIAVHAEDNFFALTAAGIAVYFFAQFAVHVGMDMGLLPITGTTLPFMSYGGSHLLTEYIALGILMSIRREGHASIRARDETELVGAI